MVLQQCYSYSDQQETPNQDSCSMLGHNVLSAGAVAGARQSVALPHLDIPVCLTPSVNTKKLFLCSNANFLISYFF